MFALLASGRFEARDASSGRLLWSLELGSARRWVELEVAGERVYARFESAVAAGLVAVSVRSRRAEWAWWAPRSGTPRPLGTTRTVGVAAGVVVWAQTVDGAYIGDQLHGIDASSGREIWTVTAPGVFGLSGSTLFLSDTPLGDPHVLRLRRVALADGRVQTQVFAPPPRSACANNAVIGVNGPIGFADGRAWAMVQDACGTYAFGVDPAGARAALVRTLPRSSVAVNPTPDLLRVNDPTRLFWLESGAADVTTTENGRLVALELATGRRIVVGGSRFNRPLLVALGRLLMVVGARGTMVFASASGALLTTVSNLEARDATVTGQGLIVHDGRRLIAVRIRR